MNFLHYSLIVLFHQQHLIHCNSSIFLFFLWHLVHHDFTMFHFHIRSFRSSLVITATNCANSTTKEGGLLKSTCTTGHCLLIYIYSTHTSMHVGLTVPSMHSVGQLDIKPLNCNSRFCQLITEFVF